MEPVGSGDANIGYQHHRLKYKLITGIIECNKRCKCDTICFNRVVQNPLQLSLQVFKTTDRGWGVRCVYDIPRGTYICSYAGELLSSEEADVEGWTKGDEYFVSLDHVEVALTAKEGYESQAEETGCEDDGNFSPPVRRWDVRRSPPHLRERAGRKFGSASPFWHAVRSTWTSPAKSGPLVRGTSGAEEPYVVDAKRYGNVSRFFNHSCDPNMFVQTVFIDTLDLRFPTIAFFAGKNIHAGDELLWDYSYVPGTGPGKGIKCRCKSYRCRGLPI